MVRPHEIIPNLSRSSAEAANQRYVVFDAFMGLSGLVSPVGFDPKLNMDTDRADGVRASPRSAAIT